MGDEILYVIVMLCLSIDNCSFDVRSMILHKPNPDVYFFAFTQRNIIKNKSIPHKFFKEHCSEHRLIQTYSYQFRPVVFHLIKMHNVLLFDKGLDTKTMHSFPSVDQDNAIKCFPYFTINVFIIFPQALLCVSPSFDHGYGMESTTSRKCSKRKMVHASFQK